MNARFVRLREEVVAEPDRHLRLDSDLPPALSVHREREKCVGTQDAQDRSQRLRRNLPSGYLEA
jgi:hypothetical protein